MLLADKVAVITGAASLRGIGWATAQRFVEEGARVVLLDLDADLASSAAAKLGDSHLGYQCDVRDAERCIQVVNDVVARLGKVDVLINNAGVSQAKRLLDSSADDYDIVMDVSMRGTYNMTRAVVPHLRARQTGTIVCVGSIAAQRGGGVLGGPHYAAAKGGVHAFSKAIARELAPEGIRVNAVAPGLVDTELIVGKIDEAGKGMVAASTPMGRLATPRDIANSILFLASDLSSYVTGVILDVNGGHHIH
ncbi:SDR family NAD(P)-dependent oxidoreductase [Burkholderia sp. Ax-1719]|uniref:SDR family NAD(P)-dependent oxidoreductase n=1 Tax=Burkholderia sp. Ax-1719 TaxID=2608334 RepID=UPI00142325B0|nr:SDR family NAD(P)-dependent oxidoreductase [Burkholderia sp. Ax-1719]NIE63101.1 SDR family oxidoreductase [Burkholderia sp. Ax-1719]